MTNAMHRGGPDDEGVLINETLGYALGHRRLSIIDLTATGHQPMVDESNEIEITFNGEIYNYLELKEELIQIGHQFKSTSDTEVLIKGYQQWGATMLPKLKGMFAFILIDKKNKTLFAARDHAGIKPLYIAHKKDEIYFSSEIRGLKAIDENWEENPNWKIWFLTFGFLPEPITTLKNVKPLPRGHYFTLNLETKEEHTVAYSKYKFSNNQLTYKEATQKTKQLVDAAVKRHLVSDVPVGVFLSGGIDSSILTIIAQQQQTSPIETISIYFDDEKYSEKEFQELIIKQTGVKHHLHKITKEEFIDSWDDIYQSLDQPSTDAINSYFICKYAKQNGLKVVLSGLGADELFGGYPSINRATQFNKYQRLAVINKFLPSFIIGSYPNKKFDFLNEKIAASEYLLYRGLFIPKDVAKILNISETDVWEEIKHFSFQEDISSLDPQNKATYYETAIYMQSQLLKDSDMQSMWHSLELRVPFLDKDLMEFVNDLHPSIKFNTNNNKPKPLLVDAYINELPNAIWNRPKQGFTFPFENWFATMNVFKNKKFVPTWVYILFTKKKLNFARLWAVFLAYSVHKIDSINNLDQVNVNCIEVVHFQRKRRAIGNHSIESIFKAVKLLQPNDIDISVEIPKFESSGFFKRYYIIIEAFFKQKDINHITGDIHFLNFLQTRKKNILTVHDCGILKRNVGLKQKLIQFLWFTLPAKKANIITVNSNYTKQDLLTYIKFPEQKIKVIYVFVPTVHKAFAKKFNKIKPTILQLGTAANKNILRIAQALKGINCKYIILGKLNDEIIAALKENKIDYENIATSISDEAVAELYRECDIVSFASTFEGFGMPIAEGNATGRVVVTSNTSSMPEIAANAAEIVNPFDVESIRNGFLKVINDDAHREQLIKNGFENVKRFDRQKIANEYFDLYRNMVK